MTPQMTVKTILTIGEATGCELRVVDGYKARDDLKARGYRFEGSTQDWVRSVDGRPTAAEWGDLLWALDIGMDVRAAGSTMQFSRAKLEAALSAAA